MFKIGDKVSIKTNMDWLLEGYIVKIEIDPLEEIEVNFDKTNYVFYTVRVFKNFYKNGYADFSRTEDDLIKEEEK